MKVTVRAKEGISKDFLTAAVIRIYNDKKKEPVWFNKLAEVLDGNVSRSTLSKYIDKLFDYGIITGDWAKNQEDNWVRVFRISGEAEMLMDKAIEKFDITI